MVVFGVQNQKFPMDSNVIFSNNYFPISLHHSYQYVKLKLNIFWLCIYFLCQ